MTETRVPAGVPTGGQFATSVRAESSVALSAPEPTVTLPNGKPYTTAQTPDGCAVVRVTDLDDGTALVTYVTRETFATSDDPMHDAAGSLRLFRNAEAVFDQATYSAHALDDFMQGSEDNLLDRVAFIKFDESGKATAHGRNAVMDDWDEFKDYAHGFDAAVVLPRDELHAYDVDHVDMIEGTKIRDFEQIAYDINEPRSGRSFTIQHEQVDLATGSVIATGSDDHDGIYDEGDADAWADSEHADAENTVSWLE